MLVEVLSSIDVKEEDLDQELAIMMRNKIMDEDNIKYLALIKDAIGYRENIRNIDVIYFNINSYLIGKNQAGESK
jgi:hypothetical protein